MLRSAYKNKATTLVLALAACVGVFSVATVLALPDTPSGTETAIFHWFNGWTASLAPAMRILTEAGSLPHTFILWLLAAYALGGRTAGLQMLAGGLGAAVLGRFAKEAIARGRPEDLLNQFHLYAGTSDGFGFPSGHCTFAAVCATVLFFYVKKPIYRAGLILLALTVGVSRLYLGPHLPLDVIGGLALGTACGIATILITPYIFQKLNIKQPKTQG